MIMANTAATTTHVLLIITIYFSEFFENDYAVISSFLPGLQR